MVFCPLQKTATFFRLDLLIGYSLWENGFLVKKFRLDSKLEGYNDSKEYRIWGISSKSHWILMVSARLLHRSLTFFKKFEEESGEQQVFLGLPSEIIGPFRPRIFYLRIRFLIRILIILKFLLLQCFREYSKVHISKETNSK